MTGLAIVLFVAAVVLIIMGISFVVDIKKNVGPTLRILFFEFRSRGVAWFVTILTFVLAAAALVGGIVILATQ